MPRGRTVLDLACGCGYGSKILHDAGAIVRGIDVCQEAIEYARQHYPGPGYEVSDAKDIADVEVDTLVSFETIEHLAEHGFLKKVRARQLIASVPNEQFFPFDAALFKDDEYPHLRHYTQVEFEALLNDAGYSVTEWWSQINKFGELYKGTEGRFMIAVAEAV